jgi:hypothetical protein
MLYLSFFAFIAVLVHANPKPRSYFPSIEAGRKAFTMPSKMKSIESKYVYEYQNEYRTEFRGRMRAGVPYDGMKDSEEFVCPAGTYVGVINVHVFDNLVVGLGLTCSNDKDVYKTSDKQIFVGRFINTRVGFGDPVYPNKNLNYFNHDTPIDIRTGDLIDNFMNFGNNDLNAGVPYTFKPPKEKDCALIGFRAWLHHPKDSYDLIPNWISAVAARYACNK